SMVGWRATREVWPALAVSGLSFAAVQFYWSNYQESGLVDVVSALASLLITAAFLKVWRPSTLMTHSGEGDKDTRPAEGRPPPRHWAAAVLKGWSPFLLASVFIFVWALPGVQKWLTRPGWERPVPYLHLRVLRVPPVVPGPEPEKALADLNVQTLPGSAVFLAA